MAGRIRTIKPELLDDEKAAGLSDAAWRLFVSSWLLADDHGRFRAGARYLAASVWQDTGRLRDAGEALAELVKVGRVRVYEVDGDVYAEIPTWSRHQRIDNAGRPRVPPPHFNDSARLPSVSPRTSANLGDSPRVGGAASDVAALPPTSDLRIGPPTTDHGPPDARAGDEVTIAPAPPRPPGPVVLPPPAPGGDLMAIAQRLHDEGNTLGTSALQRFAKGHVLTPNMRQALASIRDERAAKGQPGGDAVPSGPPKRAREPTRAEVEAMEAGADRHGMSPAATPQAPPTRLGPIERSYERSGGPGLVAVPQGGAVGLAGMVGRGAT